MTLLTPAPPTVAIGFTPHGRPALVSVSTCRCCSRECVRNPPRDVDGAVPHSQDTTSLSSARVRGEAPTTRGPSLVSLVLECSWCAVITPLCRATRPREVAGSLLTLTLWRMLTLSGLFLQRFGSSCCGTKRPLWHERFLFTGEFLSANRGPPLKYVYGCSRDLASTERDAPCQVDGIRGSAHPGSSLRSFFSRATCSF